MLMGRLRENATTISVHCLKCIHNFGYPLYNYKEKTGRQPFVFIIIYEIYRTETPSLPQETQDTWLSCHTSFRKLSVKYAANLNKGSHRLHIATHSGDLNVC